jgi:hypothetical protein
MSGIEILAIPAFQRFALATCFLGFPFATPSRFGAIIR